MVSCSGLQDRPVEVRGGLFLSEAVEAIELICCDFYSLKMVLHIFKLAGDLHNKLYLHSSSQSDERHGCGEL